MRRPFLAFLLVASAAGSTVAGTPEEDFAAARAELDAIVKAAESRARVPDGPSLTKLVGDFVSREETLVRGVEEAVWNAARRGREWNERMAVEQTIRFLHGMPRREDPGALIEYGERTGFDVVAGAVVYRWSGGTSHTGPGMKLLDAPLDEWIGDKPIRAASRTSASKLLDVEVLESDRGRVGPFDRSWSDSTLVDFGMALGEACARDDAAFATLLSRARSRPRSRHLLLALGWSRREAAIELLAGAIPRFVQEGESRSEWASLPGPLDSAMSALRHADESAWNRLIAGFTDEHLCRVTGAPTATDVVRSRLAELAAAVDTESRRAAVLRLCETVRSLGVVPGGADSVQLFHALLACVDGDDEALRASALSATDRLFACSGGRPVEFTYSGPGVERRDVGTCLGALAGTEATLRQAVADVDAGHVVYHEAEPPHARWAPVTQHCDQAVGIAPQDLAGSGREVLPVRVSASWTETGLHLRLVNESGHEFAINPVALRYGVAEKVVVTTTRKGVPPVVQTRFRIRLGGWIGLHTSVPTNRLVALPAKGMHECDISVLPALRGEPPVELAIEGGFWVEAAPMEGPAPAPIVCFGWTRIF